MASKAEQAFREVYDQLSVEYDNVIPRDVFHQRVYEHIIENCAMIASAYSPSNEDIGAIIRSTMGIK